MTDLNKLLRDAAEFAEQVFKDKGEVRPMYIVETKGGEHIPINVPFTSPEQKGIAFVALRALFREMGVVRYVVMVEAWVLRMSPDASRGDAERRTSEAYRKYGSLEHHPDRDEVINYLAEDIEGRTLQAFHRILRPEHGPAVLMPLEMMEADHAEGRMTGLLKDA